MNAFCAIISGGEFAPLGGIENAACVIACDRGYEYAARCGIKPDLLLGDFDSYTGALPAGVEVLRLPVEKDDTDTMSAVRRALALGYGDIRIYCALGGRLDHLYANIQSAAFAVRHGARAELIGRDAHIYVFTGGTLSLPPRAGWSLSLFAISDECRGVAARGTKYTLSDAVVTNSFPIGTSNEWRGTAEISVGEGVLAVMLCRMPGGR